MIEKELEKKSLIDKEKYIFSLCEYRKRFHCEKIMQINYYYDTVDFLLYHSEETLRVRQIEDDLKLQYKHNKNYINGMRVTDEYSATIDELPQNIIIKGLEARNIGFMVTERNNFNIGNCVVSLDKNYYLGFVDYEIEGEAEKECDFFNILNELNFENNNNTGKYIRYIERLLTQENKYEI